MAENTYIVEDKLNTPAEEAYKVVRTNILYYELGKKFKTLTVTSYSPGEGKTTTSINLAVSMAKNGLKVLYVDADLRKPMLMKSLVNESFKGLSNYLAGYAGLDEIVVNTSVEGFYFISCGVKVFNPSELICSARFSEFLQAVENKFDVIIVDTPPLGSVIDAAVIAAQTEGTLIVLEPGAVRYKNAQMIKEQLEKANARILGVVLNKVQKLDYKNYYEGYDYYGSKKRYARDWFRLLRRSKRVQT